MSALVLLIHTYPVIFTLDFIIWVSMFILQLCILVHMKFNLDSYAESEQNIVTTKFTGTLFFGWLFFPFLLLAGTGLLIYLILDSILKTVKILFS